MADSRYISLVENMIERKGMGPIGRDFITEALEMIDDGRAKVEIYPTGVPSLVDTIELARRLQDHIDIR